MTGFRVGMVAKDRRCHGAVDDARPRRRPQPTRPPSLLREFFLNGTPDEVIDQATQWRENRLRYLVLADASVLQRSLREGPATSVPFNKIVRGLKRL
jgi:hypothetical protein